MIFVILGTGPSMSQEIADQVKGRAKVIAVSDAYKIAPWADALVSHDSSWWAYHKDAHAFKGLKFCAYNTFSTVNKFKPPVNGCNSGLMAMCVAKELGATKILICGFDMHGTHYFGPHPAKLKNTTKERFISHLDQFKWWHGPDVINCTPGSALKKFPFMPLGEALDGIDQHVCREGLPDTAGCTKQ